MGDMRTLDPITPAQVEQIQALIDNTHPMTQDRIQTLFLNSDSLSREESISGFAHVFRIAEYALRLVVDDDGDPVQPAIEMESDQYTCAICYATTFDFEPGWHSDSCQWSQLIEVIKGTPPTG